MARKRRKVDLPPGEMDMTSMIDCVFLLIIFFMLITDLKKRDIVKLKLPNAESAVKEEDEKIIINIERKGAVWVGGEKCTFDALRDYLRRKYLNLPAGDKEADSNAYASILVKIRVDQLAEFRDVQQVLKACIDEKFYKTTFAALNHNAE
ncbi:MAG: hypothetical protein COA79_16770 [Planctomycetota bacterium]|nr:MAG: hypothetical protein COA79_16770 [Planctomycetota bacterium]